MAEKIEQLLDEQILSLLKNCETQLNSLELSKQFNVDHTKIVGELKSLNYENYVDLKQQEKKSWILTKEGQVNADKGMPEFQLLAKIPNEGIAKDALQKTEPELLKFGLSNGMKKKLFAMDKGLIKKTNEVAEDIDQKILIEISKGNDNFSKEDIDSLKKRKLIELSVLKYYLVLKGTNYQEKKAKLPVDLTQEMIASGSWEQTKFKSYNLNSLGKEPACGSLHPLLKVREQFREIMFELGFEEMPTNNYVEASFWNFDALFVPQQHPARDIQDTFFLKDPEFGEIKDKAYMKRVKEIHEIGGQGSIGWRYDWSETETRKNVLRTHTTAVSARMLHLIAQDKEFRPRKLFSIDRVFRNESLDKTHLAEFHQIEGVIAERNIGLAELKGIVTRFFNKIGITKMWFKPAYNPYTEPSMEIFGFHPLLKKKVEIGNSGVFRPEMLLPMGLPPDVQILGFGLSLERPTMIQYNVDNIRDLFGHQVNIKSIKMNPICCLK